MLQNTQMCIRCPHVFTIIMVGTSGILLSNLEVVASPPMTALPSISEEMIQQIQRFSPGAVHSPAVSCPGCPPSEMTQNLNHCGNKPIISDY